MGGNKSERTSRYRAGAGGSVGKLPAIDCEGPPKIGNSDIGRFEEFRAAMDDSPLNQDRRSPNIKGQQFFSNLSDVGRVTSGSAARGTQGLP